jgi:hypothetical protein
MFQFAVVVTVILAVLKVAAFIAWPWVWVLSPLWIYAIMWLWIVFVLAIVFVVAAPFLGPIKKF